MTAQVPEKLLFEGEELDLCNEPLELFIEQTPMTVRCMSPHTALWRGYVETWEIVEDRLYLKSLDATIEGETGHEEVGMQRVIPECPNGLSGKKLLMDYHGPRVPTGGSALFGKDAFKPDRVNAVGAREMALSEVRAKKACEATVSLVYFSGMLKAEVTRIDVQQ